MKRSLSILLVMYRIFKSLICKQKICTLLQLWDSAYIHIKSNFTDTHTFQPTASSKVHQE